MNFCPILFVVVVALVFEPAVCEPSALSRSFLAKNSFGLAGGISNLTDRQVSTRAAADLNSFVVASIQASTLSQADKQSLFSDYFNLIYRNGAMGGLLKDLFGIISPAPVPPTPAKCTTSFTVGYVLKDLSSESYPANYASNLPIDCTYVVTGDAGADALKIQFSSDIVIDSAKASLKIYNGPTVDSPLLLDVKTATAGTIPTKTVAAIKIVTVQFKSEIGAVGKWKFTFTSI